MYREKYVKQYFISHDVRRKMHRISISLLASPYLDILPIYGSGIVLLPPIPIPGRVIRSDPVPQLYYSVIRVVHMLAHASGHYIYLTSTIFSKVDVAMHTTVIRPKSKSDSNVIVSWPKSLVILAFTVWLGSPHFHRGVWSPCDLDITEAKSRS